MKTILFVILTASLAFSTVRNVPSPTGNATTDTNNINSTISAASGTDTVQFGAGVYANNSNIVFKSGTITYTCATIQGCQINGGILVDSTRNGMTVSNLVINGCGGGSNIGFSTSGISGTSFQNITFTNNKFINCLGTSPGAFIDENFGWATGSVTGNTFQDGGCYLSSCDAVFSAIHMFRMPNVTIGSNTFTHVERGIAQYFNQADITTVPSQPGIRIINNTFTRLHARAIELQACGVTGEVISGNYAHQWQDAFFGSWFFSMAQGFGNNSCTATGTLIQNNRGDATDSVLDDLVTLHTDTTLCFEASGINTVFDHNECDSLPTPEAGKPNYWNGWDQFLLSGMINGTVSNNCVVGTFIHNQAPFENPSFIYYENGGTQISDTNTTYTATHAGCPGVSSTPSITTTTLPAGVTSNPYSYTMGVTGGTGPYTWSISVGSLPTGLSISSSTGAITGTPSGSGKTNFTVKVTDSTTAFGTLATSITVNTAAGVVSDLFPGSSLNGIWTLVNPVGDCTATVSGGYLHLTAPGAALHDPSFGNVNNSCSITQAISGNFTAIAKFDSFPSQQYQFEGITATQDSTNWMYLKVSFGTVLQVIMDTSLAGVTTDIATSANITPGTSIWLSLTQSGSNWSAAYSQDGVTFISLINFTQAFTTATVGPFVGNYSSSTPSSPALAGLVDYFVNGTVADLTITHTHTGSFTQSQVGATYTITATNGGGNPTAGIVTTSTSLPTGLIATGISGTGWACTLATLTCTRSDSLAAAASYAAITLTVNVSANAATPLIPSTTVSGGGEANTSNDTATDSTVITPVVVTHNVTFTVKGTTSAGAFGTITLTDTSDNVLFTQLITATATLYTYTNASLPASNVRIHLTNGISGLRTATVSTFGVDGNATAPNAATVFTLSQAPTCNTGFLQSTVMSCTGYMEFPIVSTVTARDITAPTAPSSLTATQISANAVQLCFTGSQDDVAVISYRFTKNGTTNALTTPTAAASTICTIDNSITPGSVYSYQVSAIDATQNQSSASNTATLTASQSGEPHNGGITVSNGVVDFSKAAATSPMQSASSAPIGAADGRFYWNNSLAIPYVFQGGSQSFSALSTIPATVSKNATNAAIPNGTLCSASMCQAGTYNVDFRIWTTTAQAASTTTLTIGYNDGTFARSVPVTVLDNSAISAACTTSSVGCLYGSVRVTTDGVNPITYSTVESGTAFYSLRISVPRLQ